MDIQPNVCFTEEYLLTVDNDFRETIGPKSKAGDADFVPKPYHQVFQEKLGFLPNLSVVDLLFNKGPESLLWL
jgi:hypothetical protein